MVPGTLLVSVEPYHHVEPSIAVVVKCNVDGVCEILWCDGRTSMYSSIFISRNFEVLR